MLDSASKLILCVRKADGQEERDQGREEKRSEGKEGWRNQRRETGKEIGEREKESQT